MEDSIAGRYETSRIDATTTGIGKGTTVQSKAGIRPMVSTTWYDMYEYQKEYASSLTSGMIWGSQWDQLMLFVNGKQDGEGNDYFVTVVSGKRHTNAPAVTGNNNNDKVANIYDLEGNTRTCTMEANNKNHRVNHGR